MTVHARVAILSDTHGKVDDKLRKLFRNAVLLVHGGDVNDAKTLTAIQKLVPGAPTLVVRGNNDRGAFADKLPAVAFVDVQGVRILAAHTAAAAAKAIAEDAAHARARVVVVGHSHEPAADVKDGRLWVNPGGAGPKRFSLPRGAALLDIGAAELVARVHSLEDEELPVLLEARLTAES